MKKALILGIGGQDGSYLTDVLLAKGVEVHGVHRRSSADNLWRIRPVMDRVVFHQADVTDPVSLARVIRAVFPDEIYNEADQDHVGWSHSTASLSADVTFKAVADLLGIVRDLCPDAKVFQPVSATIFGNQPPPQNERTLLDPMSPYAVAKAAALHLCRYHRRAHRLNVWTGILYNHDSPRRCNHGYLLHDIINKSLAVAKGDATRLLLGSPRLRVEVGYAKDYMEAAVAMLESDPDDYVVATGVPCTVEDLGVECLTRMGVPDARSLIGVDPKFDRPDLPLLIGDPTKARDAFGLKTKWDASGMLRMLMNSCDRSDRS